MRLAAAPVEPAGVVGLGRAFEKLLEQEVRLLEEIGIDVAHVDVDLPLELRAGGLPITLQNVAESVVLLPVIDDAFVDLPRPLVVERTRITVLARRLEDAYEGVKLSRI